MEPEHSDGGTAARRTTQRQLREKKEDQSSIPSQLALASKDDHSCTIRRQSDTALF